MSLTVQNRVNEFLRNATGDFLDLRDGWSGWKVHRAAFRATALKSVQQLRCDVDRHLRDILQHAFLTCPYYRDTWRSVGFDGTARNAAQSLTALPLISKETVRLHRETLRSQAYSEAQLEVAYTGGTTTTPTRFYRDRGCRIVRTGRQWGILERCGYRRGLRRALVWGVRADLALPTASWNFRQWLRQFAENQDVLACATITERDLAVFYQRLRESRPPVMYGYPSALAELATYILENHLSPLRGSATITTAERLTANQRELFEKAFGGEVFNLYCTREHGCIGFECSRHHGFHIDAESVFLEVTRDGATLGPGQTGEITITDLVNRGMPMIRHVTGDLGQLSVEPCECGCHLPLLVGLSGRDTDVIYTPEGRRVPGVPLLLELFADIEAIRSVQFIQDAVESVEVKVVAPNGLSDSDEQRARAELRQHLGEAIEIRIRVVPSIDRSPTSGKFREVVSHIKPPLRSESRVLATPGATVDSEG
jgi:phenylacetate-CoA ligase